MNNTSPYPSLPQAWGIFGLFIAITLGVSVLIALIFVLSGIDNMPLLSFIGYTVTGILILWFIRIKKKSAEPEEPYIQLGTMPVLLTIILLFITISMVIITDPLTNLIPIPEFMKEIFDTILSKSTYNLVLLVIIGPVIEEILLRGIMLDGFLRRYSPVKSIFWSSLIFGLMHLNPWQFFGAFIAGLLLGYVYWKTRSLIACIFIHMVNNGIGYLLSYIYGSDLVTFAELFGNRREYLLVYFASLGITLILFLILYQILTRQNKIVWKSANSKI